MMEKKQGYGRWGLGENRHSGGCDKVEESVHWRMEASKERDEKQG